jgi:hypothetical protein
MKEREKGREEEEEIDTMSIPFSFLLACLLF